MANEDSMADMGMMKAVVCGSCRGSRATWLFGKIYQLYSRKKVKIRSGKMLNNVRAWALMCALRYYTLVGNYLM